MHKKVKIFFPVDVDSAEKAEELIKEVGPYVDVIKVGLELEKNIGTPAMVALAKKSGKEVFADVKLNDIPNTVKGAARGLTAHGVDYFNVMACGGERMMAAAVEGAYQKSKEMGIPKPKIIAVTALTSLDSFDLIGLGIQPYAGIIPFPENKEQKEEYVRGVVMKWAALAVNAGVDCLLSSPFESLAMHSRWSEKEIITPGIRMPWDPLDDQKRTMTPGQAVRNGASGLVIGRSISEAEKKGKTKKVVIDAIYADIEEVLHD